MHEFFHYDMALYHQQGLGSKAYVELTKILDHFNLSLKNIFDQPKIFSDLIENQIKDDSNQLLDINITKKQITLIEKVLKKPNIEQIEIDLEWLNQQQNHYLLTVNDPAYPNLLKQQDKFPLALYVMGNKEILNHIQIAMVGSRHPSPTGVENAQQFAYYLAQNKMVITSGMAMGIDAACHEAAIKANGHTIAVAGTGIDRVYPAKHKDLAHKIIEKGAIISEFPLKTGPLKQNFPKRNATISGLSVGTLVVEAALRSGSLITARLAMEQGREVFAIPGSIHNSLAKGCHFLIKQGAKLVETADDIIEEIQSLSVANFELNLQNLSSQDLNLQDLSLQDSIEIPKTANIDNTLYSDLTEEQKLIIDQLDTDPVSIDKLQLRCHLPIEIINAQIMQLEILGIIQVHAGAKISKKTSEIV